MHSAASFIENKNVPASSLEEQEYSLEDGRYSSGVDRVGGIYELTYSYLDVPIVLYSCDLESITLTNEDVNYILKEEDITLSDKEMILSKKGAKILNNIYKTFNYYWGQ